jgi:hypothetical protein
MSELVFDLERPPDRGPLIHVFEMPVDLDVVSQIHPNALKQAGKMKQIGIGRGELVSENPRTGEQSILNDVE